jgi:hypothetical protein
MSYNVFITEEDFRKERSRWDREDLNRIDNSKSLNKLWMAYVNGFDSDYDPVPAPGQNE